MGTLGELSSRRKAQRGLMALNYLHAKICAPRACSPRSIYGGKPDLDPERSRAGCKDRCIGNGQTPVTRGDFLRRQYGDKLVTVGFLFYQGSFKAIRLDASGQSGVMAEFGSAEPPPGNVESYFHSSGIPRFAIDLRGIQPGRPGADRWLQPHPFRNIGLSMMMPIRNTSSRTP